MIVFKTTSLIKLSLLCIFFSIAITYSARAAETEDNLAQCSTIEKDADRLKCFDKLASHNEPINKSAPAVAGESKLPKESAQNTEQLSVMTKHWDLDHKHRKHAFALRPYRPNYFLPVAYNSSPNDDTLDFDPNAKAQHTEAKFQLSFKVKLWEDLFDKNIDLWLGYTQLAFWQLYNTPFSSPLRDTNYEPELLINFRTNYELLGFKGRFINIGFNHQSNGRSLPLSHGWNRIVANVGLEKDNFGLLLKTWYRIPEDENKDDNPDINRYMGYGEIWGTYYWKKQKFAVMFRNNLRSENNLGAIQLDWSFPLPFIKNDLLYIYFQYFNGYGESLLDYNKSINRISVGFMLADWNWN